MYMFGRLRTASRPSSTLIASVPYSSAPFPFVGRRVFSAVSRGVPRSFSERLSRVGEPPGCSRRRGAKQPLRPQRTHRNHSGKKARNGPIFDPEEGRVGARRGVEQAPVGGRQDRLRLEPAQVPEEIAVLRRIELGGDVVEEEERRAAEGRAEGLDRGGRAGEHPR